MGDDELEIKDVESYYGSKAGETFSHSQLVMISMKKCIEAGTKEMKEGYMNEKADRYGNVIRTYVPDTRKEFIETVETLKMIMADDLDHEANLSIGKLNEKLKKTYDDFCGMEEQEWNGAHQTIQHSWKTKGIFFRKGMLHQGFPYYIEYLMERVKTSRDIFAELKKLTQRKDYYAEEVTKL